MEPPRQRLLHPFFYINDSCDPRSHQGFGGSMALQNQNGTPKTTKRRLQRGWVVRFLRLRISSLSAQRGWARRAPGTWGSSVRASHGWGRRVHDHGGDEASPYIVITLHGRRKHAIYAWEAMRRKGTERACTCQGQSGGLSLPQAVCLVSLDRGQCCIYPYIYDLQRFQISRPPYLYALDDPWSQQGFDGSMVKKFHTLMGRPSNATSNWNH